MANTGSMISAEHIRNVFDRFYKIDMHHTGSGIGLALVKAFVEMHGGMISVESDEKQGTVFTVELLYSLVRLLLPNRIPPLFLRIPVQQMFYWRKRKNWKKDMTLPNRPY